MAAMLSLNSLLATRVAAAAGVDPEMRPATKPQFGHFQSNVALRLAKIEGVSPRQVALRLVEQIRLEDVCEPLEIAGPGFINFRIRNDVLARVATEILADPNVGIDRAPEPQTVVIDYSAPNVAKQMHVGHLRSTIIGDCFNRVLSAQGHRVVAQNHIGDWGRQFGMLVEQVLDEQLDLAALNLAGAEELYLRANARLVSDEAFAERARDRVVLLQAGDAETLAIWHRLIELSEEGFNATYARLGVLLTDADVAGESMYNDMLPEVCEDLTARGIATMDDDALVVFVEGIDIPAILRNKNGGYGYDTTDVAAIRYRIDTLGANRIIYVVGTPQALHFQVIFGVARKAGYLTDDVDAVHVSFGQVLGADGKKFSTRQGTAVHLDDLLDEAERHAARPIALAALKYADLSSQLQKDYAFDAERMTATIGNTGPYLQYAHARLSRILRNAAQQGLAVGETVTVLAEPEEQALALQLSRFGEAVADVAENLQPHKLCTYLYETATALSAFYEQCPVLKADGDVRASRLALCAATRLVLAKGLDLLGIEAPDNM